MTELPRGHVKEVCKEWLVREDGALAQRLQSQEINDFYQNNKVRNAIVREDFPRALDEQRKEVEVAKEVEQKYREYLENQERTDRLLAEKLEHNLKIEKLRNEEIECNKAKEIALKLQKREEEVEKQRMLAIQNESEKTEKLAKKLQMYEERYNITQAERDRLIAIRAQNEELVEKDRQMAIEAQDEELAKMLQEREKKRAKRLREKHRLKKQQQQLVMQQQSEPHFNTNSINDSMTTDKNSQDIEDTYSDPIDLVSPQENKQIPNENDKSISNYDNSITRRPRNSFGTLHDNFPNYDDESADDTYALPVNVKQKEELVILREKKPKLPKPNSIHELPNHITTANMEFVSKENTATSLTKGSNYPIRGNISNPTTPICSGDNSLLNGLSSDSYNRKKKDKRDKCTHQ